LQGQATEWPASPPALRSYRLKVLLLSPLPLLATAAAFVLARTLLAQADYMWRLFVGLMVPILGCLLTVALVHRLITRVDRLAAEHDFALCPHCMYPCPAEQGTCNECGRPYIRSEIRKRWMAHRFES
jgi:hypothetical protein